MRYEVFTYMAGYGGDYDRLILVYEGDTMPSDERCLEWARNDKMDGYMVRTIDLHGFVEDEYKLI